jgi:protein O-mannosyl-transferase
VVCTGGFWGHFTGLFSGHSGHSTLGRRGSYYDASSADRSGTLADLVSSGSDPAILWGDEVLGYHLVNVSLHATAACLFATVLRRIRPGSGESNSRWQTGWLAASVFALHPVCVESVAWISEQKNTLSLVFYLLAALAHFRFDRDRRATSYVLALVLFVFALLSKSVTATLPAALLLFFYWQRGKLAWKRDVFPLLPWFAIGIGAGLFTAWVEHHYIGAWGAAYELTLLQRCFLAGRVTWFYLSKLLWPTNLIFIYPRWQVETTVGWSLWAVGFVAVIGGLWRGRKVSRAPLVAVLFFTGSLFPALGFFNVYPFIFSYVADHWQYLPCLGIIALAVYGMAGVAERLVERLPGPQRGVGRLAATALAVLLLALLFSLTWRQAGIYRNVETLYADTLAKNPACWLAHNNLGLSLMEAGSLTESIAHLEEAIRLKPDGADAYNNLGNALSKIPGHALESIAAFEQALRYYPDMAEAHSNLGWALINSPDRLQEGIAHLRIAVRLRPEFFRARNSLGIGLTKMPGRLPEAMAEFETALLYDPDYVASRINLGNALVTAGRFPEAIAQLERAWQTDPENPQIHYNLGTAFARAGKPVEAAAAFERSLKLQPANAEVENNLANVLAELGRDSDSISHYRAALQVDPNSAKTHFNLALALRAVGDGSEAIAHFRESLRLAPEVPEIWNALGSFLFRLGKLSDAAIAYREAVGLRSESALFQNNLGIALTENRQFEEAITHLRIAVQLEPGFADAHHNLGVALQQAGRTEEAAAEFKASGRKP